MTEQCAAVQSNCAEAIDTIMTRVAKLALILGTGAVIRQDHLWYAVVLLISKRVQGAAVLGRRFGGDWPRLEFGGGDSVILPGLGMPVILHSIVKLLLPAVGSLATRRRCR